MSRFYVHVYLHVYSLSLLFDCLLFAGCWCSQFWESLDCLCVCVHVLHLFLQLFYWCVAAYVCVCVWFLGEIVFFFNLGFCVCVSSIHNNSTCIRAIHRDTTHHWHSAARISVEQLKEGSRPYMYTDLYFIYHSYLYLCFTWFKYTIFWIVFVLTEL